MKRNAEALLLCVAVVCSGVIGVVVNQRDEARAERDRLRDTYEYIGRVCDWYVDGSVVCPPGTHAVEGAVPTTTTVAK